MSAKTFIILFLAVANFVVISQADYTPTFGNGAPGAAYGDQHGGAGGAYPPSHGASGYPPSHGASGYPPSHGAAGYPPAAYPSSGYGYNNNNNNYPSSDPYSKHNKHGYSDGYGKPDKHGYSDGYGKPDKHGYNNNYPSSDPYSKHNKHGYSDGYGKPSKHGGYGSDYQTGAYGSYGKHGKHGPEMIGTHAKELARSVMENSRPAIENLKRDLKGAIMRNSSGGQHGGQKSGSGASKLVSGMMNKVMKGGSSKPKYDNYQKY